MIIESHLELLSSTEINAMFECNSPHLLVYMNEKTFREIGSVVPISYK